MSGFVLIFFLFFGFPSLCQCVPQLHEVYMSECVHSDMHSFKYEILHQFVCFVVPWFVTTLDSSSVVYVSFIYCGNFIARCSSDNITVKELGLPTNPRLYNDDLAFTALSYLSQCTF